MLPHLRTVKSSMVVVAFVLAVHYNLGTCEGACARERERERIKDGERAATRERECVILHVRMCVCARVCADAHPKTVGCLHI
jgi:hypothetical protein